MDKARTGVKIHPRKTNCKDIEYEPKLTKHDRNIINVHRFQRNTSSLDL
jgi:hypothetical protein